VPKAKYARRNTYKYENNVLTKIFGAMGEDVTGGWRKPHNKELPDLPHRIKIG